MVISAIDQTHFRVGYFEGFRGGNSGKAGTYDDDPRTLDRQAIAFVGSAGPVSTNIPHHLIISPDRQQPISRSRNADPFPPRVSLAGT
ncbi:MAG: hypothetical protein AAAB11_12745, partial [Rhizobium giardinii]